MGIWTSPRGLGGGLFSVETGTVRGAGPRKMGVYKVVPRTLNLECNLRPAQQQYLGEVIYPEDEVSCLHNGNIHVSSFKG